MQELRVEFKFQRQFYDDRAASGKKRDQAAVSRGLLQSDLGLLIHFDVMQ